MTAKKADSPKKAKTVSKPGQTEGQKRRAAKRAARQKQSE